LLLYLKMLFAEAGGFPLKAQASPCAIFIRASIPRERKLWDGGAHPPFHSLAMAY